MTPFKKLDLSANHCVVSGASSKERMVTAIKAIADMENDSVVFTDYARTCIYLFLANNMFGGWRICPVLESERHCSSSFDNNSSYDDNYAKQLEKCALTDTYCLFRFDEDRDGVSWCTGTLQEFIDAALAHDSELFGGVSWYTLADAYETFQRRNAH